MESIIVGPRRNAGRSPPRNQDDFSGWLAETAAHRLRLDAGRRAVTAWEREHGALTADERAEGLARARALLGRWRARPASSAFLPTSLIAPPRGLAVDSRATTAGR
jgi:hypothetical protein